MFSNKLQDMADRGVEWGRGSRIYVINQSGRDVNNLINYLLVGEFIVRSSALRSYYYGHLMLSRTPESIRSIPWKWLREYPIYRVAHLLCSIRGN